MKKTIKLIRTYTTTFEIEADSTADAMKKFSELPDDIKYEKELEQMDVDEIVKVSEDRFARKCDFSGEGMNEGWVFGDGEMYAKYKGDVEMWVKHLGYDSIEDAYDDEAVYWTEWEDESEFQYELIDGELIEIQ